MSVFLQHPKSMQVNIQPGIVESNDEAATRRTVVSMQRGEKAFRAQCLKTLPAQPFHLPLEIRHAYGDKIARMIIDMMIHADGNGSRDHAITFSYNRSVRRMTRWISNCGNSSCALATKLSRSHMKAA